MGLSFRYFQKALSMYTNHYVFHLVLILTKLGEAEGVEPMFVKFLLWSAV